VGTNLGSSWSTRRLSDFLAVVREFDDEDGIRRGLLEHSAETMRADAGAIVLEGRVTTAYGVNGERARELVAIAGVERGYFQLAGIGPCSTVAIRFDDGTAALILVRADNEDFSNEEVLLVEGLARIADLRLMSLRSLRQAEASLEEGREREAQNASLVRELVDAQRLFERLARIQRSISHRAPLEEVLDAITAGAGELLGDEVVGLRLLDPEDHRYMVLRSVSGLEPEIVATLERGPVGEGVGGQAIKENRLVIVEDYQDYNRHLPALADAGLQAAMAAPVYEYGKLAGSLVVASYTVGRRYRRIEQDLLLAFAEHASLALTDARTVERLREAQQAKDMFFAMASHELKTPLTVIMGTLRTIEIHHAALPDHVRAEMLSSAYERARDLKELIDRLLQGARAELAGMTKKVPLRDLVARAARGFDSSRLEIDGIPDQDVETDDLAVHDVLGVFLENAFKHSPHGTKIVIGAAIDHDIVHLRVENEGSLPTDVERDTLFEPFRRGSESDGSGVGLGLYIAARLATAIHGEVDVTSQEDQVTFWLRFPADETVVATRPPTN
jgi:signal transduction histidine kinase